MSEARKEILQMLKDGVIGVDDAERLLKAVTDSEKTSENESPAAKLRGSVKTALSALNEGLAGIGPAVSSIVSEATAGISGAVINGGIPEGYEQITLADNGFSVEAGSEIRVFNKRVKSNTKGGDLLLNGVEGSICTVNADNGAEVYKKGSNYIIQWVEGDIAIDVPKHIGSIKGATMGGDVQFKGIECPADINTMGGDIEAETHGALSAKTMGGDVEVDVYGMLDNSQATTMGGDIKIRIHNKAGFLLNASTMAGDIKVDGEHIQKKNSLPMKKAKIKVGDSEEHVLKLTTMGGNIKIECVDAFCKW